MATVFKCDRCGRVGGEKAAGVIVVSEKATSRVPEVELCEPCRAEVVRCLQTAPPEAVIK